jgi:hypothetical protein
VFTGKHPYAHLANDGAVVIEVLVNNGRPPRPENLSADQVWELMQQCWQLDPANRPLMHEVCLALSRADGTMTVDVTPGRRAGEMYRTNS